MVKPKQCYTKSNMVPILDIYLFSTDNFVKIFMGRSCINGISVLASLFVTKKTHELGTVLFGALMPILCIQK